MMFKCHVDMVEDHPPPLKHIQLTLHVDSQLVGADRQVIPIRYEAIAHCNHVSEIGGAFAKAFAELTRQIAQKNL